MHLQHARAWMMSVKVTKSKPNWRSVGRSASRTLGGSGLGLGLELSVRVRVGVRADPSPDPYPNPNPNPAAQTGAASRTLGGASVSE